MASPINCICLCSYNSTGFGISSQNYISSLLVFSDILCIQEHFLQHCKDKKVSNTSILRKKFDDEFDMFIVPAVKNCNQISRGRGAGGLATIWKRSLTKFVSQASCKSSRLQATKFDLPSSPLLVINAYFPCDPQNDSFDDTELINLLAEVKSIIENNQFYNVVIAGDLNCHF